jgi:hypothetical protein
MATKPTNSVYKSHHSLMTETETVCETLNFCSELTRLITQEDFILWPIIVVFVYLGALFFVLSVFLIVFTTYFYF